MAYLNEVTKKAWPRWGVHKATGARARFDCAGDMSPAYELEIPLDPPKAAASSDATVAELMRQLAELKEQVAKKGPGRPRLDKSDD